MLAHGGQDAGSGGKGRRAEPNRELRFLAEQEKDLGITINQKKKKSFFWDPSFLEVGGKDSAC